MRRRVTLRDVAEVASVSIATASRGYRHDPSISLRTQQLVLQADPILEYACHEGNYAMQGILGGKER